MNFKEYFLGTAQEREAEKSRKTLSASDSLSFRKKARLDNVTRISRRRFLRLGLAGAVAATLGSFGLYESLKDKNEIMLGKLRFYLQNESEWTSEEKETLFRQMQNAHQKLVAYFGDEIVGGMSGNIPIQKGGRGILTGMVQTNGRPKFDPSGEVSTDQIENPNLIILNTASESTIYHEFTHLFIQRGWLLPQSFMEGHAHALTRLAYGEHYDPPELAMGGSFDGLLAYNEVHSVLDMGLDFNQFENLYQGGLTDISLQRLLRSKWESEWVSFVTQHPQFFHKFYKALRKSVELDQLPLNRSLTLQVATAVEPDFEKWYQETPSMHSMNEHPSVSLSNVINIPEKQMLVLNNMTTHPAQVEGQKVTPSFLGLNIPYTDYSIEFEDEKGQVDSLALNDVKTPFVLFKIPNALAGHRLKSVTLGGVDLPIVEASKK